MRKWWRLRKLNIMMKSGNSRNGDGDKRTKYTALKQDDSHSNGDRDVTDTSPLLESVECLSIGSPKNDNTSDQTLPNDDINLTKNKKAQCDTQDAIAAGYSGKNKTEHNDITDNGDCGESTNNKPVEDPKCISIGAKEDLIKIELEETKTPKQHLGEELDIVRKKSQPMSPNYVPWQRIGPYQKLKLKSCQRLYAATGSSDDVALFFHNGRFHAMEAWCTHMGGPLYQGDIEDYNGKSHVMCPWHSYMFDLETGNNEIGLKQKIYQLKFEAGLIWIRYHCPVTTEPANRRTSHDQSGRASEINIQKVKARKKSVLDSPLSLS